MQYRNDKRAQGFRLSALKNTPREEGSSQSSHGSFPCRSGLSTSCLVLQIRFLCFQSECVYSEWKRTSAISGVRFRMGAVDQSGGSLKLCALCSYSSPAQVCRVEKPHWSGRKIRASSTTCHSDNNFSAAVFDKWRIVK